MNDQQLLRYSRQIMLPQMDIEGQEKLGSAKVLVVGVGGLGCPAAMYLASAGVGQITLVDDDLVELNNLQRQIAHTTLSVGDKKVESAKNSLNSLNPEIKVNTLALRLEGEQLNSEVSKADVIVDCCDNIATRFALNKASIKYKVPLVSGSAIRMEAQLTVFDPGQGHSPCYHCLYGDNTELELSCSESGVIAPLVGVIGSMQALETIKVITGIGKSLVGRLLLFDASTMQWQELKLAKNENCNVCKRS